MVCGKWKKGGNSLTLVMLIIHCCDALILHYRWLEREAKSCKVVNTESRARTQPGLTPIQRRRESETCLQLCAVITITLHFLFDIAIKSNVPTEVGKLRYLNMIVAVKFTIKTFPGRLWSFIPSHAWVSVITSLWFNSLRINLSNSSTHWEALGDDYLTRRDANFIPSTRNQRFCLFEPLIVLSF